MGITCYLNQFQGSHNMWLKLKLNYWQKAYKLKKKDERFSLPLNLMGRQEGSREAVKNYSIRKLLLIGITKDTRERSSS